MAPPRGRAAQPHYNRVSRRGVKQFSSRQILFQRRRILWRCGSLRPRTRKSGDLSGSFRRPCRLPLYNWGRLCMGSYRRTRTLWTSIYRLGSDESSVFVLLNVKRFVSLIVNVWIQSMQCRAGVWRRAFVLSTGGRYFYVEGAAGVLAYRAFNSNYWKDTS